MADDDFSLVEKSGAKELTESAPLLARPENLGKRPLRLVTASGAIPASEEQPKKKRGRPPKVKPEPTPEELAKRMPQWEPEEKDFRTIRELAELAWPASKIYEVLGISAQAWAGAIIRIPRVKEEYEAGVAACKGFNERKLSWRPRPSDIEEVRRLASESGLREPEIAAKLGVSRQAFAARMADTPQLAEAYEIGEGMFRASLMETSQNLLDARSEDLKYVTGMMSLKLKAYCGVTDKPAQGTESKVTVQGEVKHTVTLSAPKPVPVTSLADFAAQEMARAKEESALKLKEAQDAVDAEVVQ